MKKQCYTKNSFFGRLHSVVNEIGRSNWSLKQVSFLVLSLLVFSGCQKEYTIEKQDWQYDRDIAFAGPLLNNTITAIELVEKIQEDNGVDNPVGIKIDTSGIIEEGLLFVEYVEEFNYTWADIVDIPSKSYDGAYTISSLKSIASHTDTIPLNGKPTQRFDEGEFSDGNISISIGGVSGDFKVEFLNVKKDGNHLVVDNVTGGGTPTSVGLSGYHVDFVHNADKTESGLRVIISVNNLTGAPIPPISFTYDINISNLSPDYLTGYFGQESPMDSTFSMDVTLFKELDFLEQVKFKGPRAYVDYKNYFGVPVRAQILNTRLLNTEGKMSEELDWDDDEAYDINNADWNNGNGVIPRIDQLVIGEDNSNIEDLINMYPNRVEFRALISANPEGEVVGSPNFVTDRNDFFSDLRVMLPFWLRAEAYVRQDTIDFDVEDLFQYEEDLEEVDPIDLFDLAELTFRFTNGFPFNINVNIIAESDGKAYTDALIVDKPLFGKSNIDSNGAVDTTNLEPSEFIVSLTTSKLKEYRANKVKRIILYETASTAGNPVMDFVKVHDYNFLKTKVMLEIDSEK